MTKMNLAESLHCNLYDTVSFIAIKGLHTRMLCLSLQTHNITNCKFAIIHLTLLCLILEPINLLLNLEVRILFLSLIIG